MEAEINRTKVFYEEIKEKAEEGKPEKVTKKKIGSLPFKVGLSASFLQDGSTMIEKDDVDKIVDSIEKDILEKPTRAVLKTLWVVSQRVLYNKLKYVKYTNDGVTYTYRGE